VFLKQCFRRKTQKTVATPDRKGAGRDSDENLARRRKALSPAGVSSDSPGADICLVAHGVGPRA
jgi:hypothetical protein